MMRLRKRLFIIYLILIPFSIPSFFAGVLPFNTYSVSFSIVPFIFAFIAYFIHDLKSKTPINSFWLSSLIAIVLLSAYNLLLGLINYDSFGTLYGDNSVTATLSFTIYPIFAWMIIWLNSQGLKDIGIKSVRRVFLFWIASFIVISVLQVLVLVFRGSAGIYDKLNVFGFFRNSEYLLSEKRICGYLKEPSMVGGFTICLLVPYCFFEAFFKKKKSYFWLFFILLLLSLLSFSSTTYVAFVAFLITTFVFFFRGRKTVSKSVLGLIAIVFVACLSLIAVYFSDFERLFLKITDLSNMSTAYRYSVVYNDWVIFLKHPFGIGNGNQGFFYNDIASYFYDRSQSPEILYAMNGGYGLLGGGPFFGALISGYGLIGIFVFFIIYRRMVLLGKGLTNSFSKYMFFVSLVNFTVMGTINANINLDFIFPLIVGGMLASLGNQIVPKKAGQKKYQVRLNCDDTCFLSMNGFSLSHGKE